MKFQTFTSAELSLFTLICRATFDNEKLIATACVKFDEQTAEAELVSFFVAPTSINKGLGTEIWHWLESQFFVNR